MAMSMLRRGRLIPVPPVEQALHFLESEGEPVVGGSRRITAGTPAQVRAGLETLAQQYGADEVIVVTITYDHAARRRPYELLAEAFGLDAALPRAA
jgi:alkanesulfonate monooxygenase SsuD/methylene tetrahydromethanopterin reductase-like flavin-dependent oxidoreductase (luciferase family)